MANNKGTITSEQIIESKAIEDVAKLNKELLSILETMNQLSKSASGITSIKQANAAITQNKDAYDKTNIALKERDSILKRLQSQEEKNRQSSGAIATELAKVRYESQQINKTNKQSAILTSQYADAYTKLATRLAIAKTNLKNLTIEQGKNSLATKKAAAEYEKLNAKVRSADAAAGDFQRNVGNYPLTLKSLVSVGKQLIGVFGVVEGIRLGAQLVKDSIALAKEAKGVEFAFERLGKTGVTAFENVKKSTRGLLSELDIKKALVDFDNFNISLEESDTLFEFLSVRAAQTGKSMDYLRDSLVEGLSKESKLRIDNLGISAGELNAELEKTPDFVQAVANIAKREIKQAGDILDEASNSATRFNASMENISLNWGKVFTQVKGSSFINNALDKYTEGVDNLNFALENNIGIMKALQMNFRNFYESGREENKRIKEETELRKENAKAIKEETAEYVKRNGSIGPLVEGSGGGDPLYFPGYPEPEEQKRLLADINKELEKYNTQLSDGEFSTREEAKAIQDKIEALEKEKEAILGTTKAKKDLNVAIEGTIDWYNKEISKENEFQTNTAKTSKEIQNSTQKVEEYNKAIERLIGLQSKVNGSQKGFENINQTNSDGNISSIGTGKPLSEINEEILKSTSFNALKELENDVEQYKNAEERKTEIARLEGERRSEIFGELTSTFSKYYDVDLSAFDSLIENKTISQSDWASTINSISSSILEGQLMRYDLEMEKNREVLDTILNDKFSSDKKKEQAQKEYDKKEKIVKLKQAKANRDYAIFQILIDTAQAVIKAVAASPTTGGLPFSAIALGLGLAQAAYVRAQPLPKFFKGTENAPRGWAWTDERGPEIHTDKHGNIKDWGSASGARTKFLDQGDKIFTASQSKELIKYSQFDKNIKLPTGNIKDLVSQRLARDTQQRTAMFAVNTGVDSKEIARAVERAMGKFTGKSFNIHNNVTISNPNNGYHR